MVKVAGSSPNLASTLNITAFNLGNLVGAGLSAAALSYGMGLVDIPLIAAGVALVAALFAGWVSHHQLRTECTTRGRSEAHR